MFRQMNPRQFEALRDWVVEKTNSPSVQLQPLTGDASPRLYFRILPSVPAQVAVFSPPTSQKNTELLTVNSLLAHQGVRVPSIYEASLSDGYFLVEDLGDQPLINVLQGDNAHEALDQALSVALDFIDIDVTKASHVPDYDDALLRRELGLFQGIFLSDWLCLQLSEEEACLIDELNEQLIGRALNQPQVFVHRDFHSRNVMIKQQKLYVIDYQDAVRGPLTYDCVSLLKDCYLDIGDAVILQKATDFYQAVAKKARLPASYTEHEFLTDFHWVGLQRHLKVLGIFVRLSLQEQRHEYLAYLPRLFNLIESVISSSEVFEGFHDFWHERVKPVATNKLDKSL